MELPQRLMMQSALFALMQIGGVPDAARWAVLCCAAVWCFGIVTQAMLTKQTLDRALFAELADSLVFSIGVGYAYQQTGLLALFMARSVCSAMHWRGGSCRKLPCRELVPSSEFEDRIAVNIRRMILMPF